MITSVARTADPSVRPRRYERGRARASGERLIFAPRYRSREPRDAATRDRLGPAVDAELAEDVRDVAPGGLLADHQALRRSPRFESPSAIRPAPRRSRAVSPPTPSAPAARAGRLLGVDLGPDQARAATRRRCPRRSRARPAAGRAPPTSTGSPGRGEAERHEDRRERVGVGHHRVEAREARAQLHVDALDVEPAGADRGREHLAACRGRASAAWSARGRPGAAGSAREVRAPTRGRPDRASSSSGSMLRDLGELQDGADRAVRARGRRRSSRAGVAHQRPSSAAGPGGSCAATISRMAAPSAADRRLDGVLARPRREAGVAQDRVLDEVDEVGGDRPQALGRGPCARGPRSTTTRAAGSGRAAPGRARAGRPAIVSRTTSCSTSPSGVSLDERQAPQGVELVAHRRPRRAASAASARSPAATVETASSVSRVLSREVRRAGRRAARGSRRAEARSDARASGSVTSADAASSRASGWPRAKALTRAACSSRDPATAQQLDRLRLAQRTEAQLAHEAAPTRARRARPARGCRGRR